MISGGLTSSCSGDYRDTVLDVQAKAMRSGVRFSAAPNNLCRGRFVAPFVNGVWTGRNVRAPMTGRLNFFANVDTSRAVSLLLLETGDADTFSRWVPSALARYLDCQSAARLCLVWSAGYQVSDVTGDSSLSAIVITGAKRGANVAHVAGFPTRGQLTYSISLDITSTTCFIRWYAGTRLVAEGSTTVDGPVTCSEVKGSGLTVDCVLAYSGDLTAGVALLDVLWPARYPIHYSTDPLVFPREPEAYVEDDGSNDYVYLSPPVAPGNYNYNVIQIDDEADVQGTITVPGDSPLPVLGPPAAPTITGVSVVVAGGLVYPTVTWTAGEALCDYTIYSSVINHPVNWGHIAAPAPTSAPLPYGILFGDPFGSDGEHTTATLLPFAVPTPVDNTSDWATFEAAWDAIVAALNTGFAAGETDFTTALPVQLAAAQDALDALAYALGVSLYAYKRQFGAQGTAVSDGLLAVAGAGLSLADWQAANGAQYGGLLGLMGAMIDGNSERYALPSGAIAAQVGGASGLTESLWQVAQPLVKPCIWRCAVRATKDGLQELNDNVFAVELDDTGAVVGLRPNAANIEEIDLTGATLSATVTAQVLEDNAAVTAASVDLLVNGSVVANAALPAIADGAHAVALTYSFGAAGWYDVAVRALSADSVPGETSQPRKVWISDALPGAVRGLSGQVLRGRGAA